ncbi:MAG: DUF4157 domain-containing protein [Acidimicrobiia bacterium]
MRVERRDGAVWVISRLVAPGASATTIGPLVFITPQGFERSRLRAHELVHVAQWGRLGWVGFLRRYLSAYLRWRLRRYPHWAAYRRIPLEIEADWEARGSGLSSPPVDP